MLSNYTIIQLKQIISNYNLKNRIKIRNRKTNETDENYKFYLVETMNPFFEVINGIIKQREQNIDYQEYSKRKEDKNEIIHNLRNENENLKEDIRNIKNGKKKIDVSNSIKINKKLDDEMAKFKMIDNEYNQLIKNKEKTEKIKDNKNGIIQNLKNEINMLTNQIKKTDEIKMAKYEVERNRAALKKTNQYKKLKAGPKFNE